MRMIFLPAVMRTDLFLFLFHEVTYHSTCLFQPAMYPLVVLVISSA